MISKNMQSWYNNTFPNGFTNWYETFFEVVGSISHDLCEVSNSKRIQKVEMLEGRGGLYELAKELTDKFEKLHKDTPWEELDFFDVVDKFLEKELYENRD